MADPGDRLRWPRRLASAVILIVLAGVYLVSAHRHAREVNTDMETVDQSAYMNYARKMHTTRYAHVGDRNRMPAYPFLLSLLYREGMDDRSFFERAKRFNIALSIVLAGVLLATFCRYLPWSSSLLLIAIVAFTLFVHRAAYVQCELLHYTLAFLGFVLVCETLDAPGWRRAAAAGVVLGLAHLTKASTLPAVVLFAAVGVAGGLRRPFDMRRPAAAILACLCFVAVLFPYISTSRKHFGRWFYNVNSTFYMWYDTRDEIFSGTRAHGDRQGWPDLPPDQIPGPARYWREHTVGDMVSRVASGFISIWNTAQRGYGYLKYVIFYAVFAAAALAWRPRAAIALARDHLFVTLLAVSHLVTYLILFAWISQVHAGLHRLILSLLLPLIFGLAWIAFGRGLLPRRTVTMANLGVLSLLTVDLWFLIRGGILTTRGGS